MRGLVYPVPAFANKYMNRPLLSIAIPTYNGSKTIKDLLDSIASQMDERFEVLVINNCSTDNTLQIVESYKDRLSNLRIINQSTNVGPDANFLDCFKKAEGKYVHLISDDDVYIENSIAKILDVLSGNDDISLAYLQTVGFYGKYTGWQSCDQREWNNIIRDIVTSDKRIFMEYAHHYWGFVSSFICLTDKIKTMDNPEQYFHTYWLQSYIHAFCANELNSKMAIIAGPCIGAGRYINVNNFDSALVDGVYYLKMLKYAYEECGFNKKQLLSYWKKRLFMLARHNFIKEKAIGVKKQSFKNLFKVTWRYPDAWISVYPFALVPTIVCKVYNNYYRSKRNIEEIGGINRLE